MLLSCGCYAWSVWASPDFGQFADQSEALAFARDFELAWRDGDFPPRWAPTANGGRGSLGFVVYPPFFSFVTATVMGLGCSLQDALRWAVMAVTLGTFWAVYFLARGWLGSRRSALAAALSLLLPGTVFIAAGRGMFANYSALLWVAVFLGAAERVNRRERVALWALVMVASGAGLVLSHTLTAYMFFLLIVAGTPFWFRPAGLKGIAAATAVLGLIMAITCWYWVPLLNAGEVTQAVEYSDRHPYTASVFFGSAAADSGYQASWEGLHFAGKMVMGAQLVLGLALLAALGRAKRDPFIPRALPWVCGFVGLASFAPFAGWLAAIPHFEMTQFAWRWQLFLSLWCALGLATAGRGLRAGAARLSAVFPLLLSAPMFWASDVSAHGDAGPLPAAITETELDGRSAAVRAAYAGNIIAVRPRGADHTYYLPAEPGRVEVVSGDVMVTALEIRASRREYRVVADSPSLLRLYTYHFPGWSASLGGNPVKIETEDGTMLQIVRVPPGTWTLTHCFRVPWR